MAVVSSDVGADLHKIEESFLARNASARPGGLGLGVTLAGREAVEKVEDEKKATNEYEHFTRFLKLNHGYLRETVVKTYGANPVGTEEVKSIDSRLSGIIERNNGLANAR